jgi:epoxyqueuosine reductase
MIPSPPPDAAAVWREEALAAGFDRVGFARAGRPPHFEDFRQWIAQGRQAGMAYLARTANLRADPEVLLPGARSVVCLAARHESRPLVAADGSRLARYAAGPDYHWNLRQMAERAAQAAARRMERPVRYRICVDSTPVAERAFAAAAGLGWIGKNGCLIDPELGSFLLLAEILTDVQLPHDDPIADRCGSCNRCLEACPTQAFVSPGVLDARRCLAYWTIEHRGPLPDPVKARIGPHVFGCDVCQEVCPFNAPLLPPAPSDVPTRAQWLEAGRGAWRRRWGATALNRSGHRGLQRNAAASAGAMNDGGCADLLRRYERAGDAGLADAAAWAARQLGSGESTE